jgi:hypothetical protein
VITLLLHPQNGFANQSRQFRRGKLPRFHEDFPCGACCQFYPTDVPGKVKRRLYLS